MKNIILVLLFVFKLQSYFCQVPDSTSLNDNSIEAVVENPAEYPGGNNAMYQFISNNLSLPESGIQKKISGKCYVRFVVEKNGEISNVTLLKGINDCVECNESALQIVKSLPKMKPAKNEGKIVRSYYVLPIAFNFE